MTEPPSQEADLIAATVDGHADGEAPPAGEVEATAKIVAMIEETVRSSAAGGPAHRDAHPKAHGLARARLEVLAGLPADLAVGLFAETRSYDAWVRFSNASPTPRSDKIGDARGMAIKIVGVEASRSGTQDFLMIDFPRFLVRDAIDYVAFQSAATPLGFFFPSFNPFRWRLRELTIGRGITGGKIANPLNARYWSTTPLLFGAAACKVSARPSGPASAFTGAARADFLHANLAAHLAAAGATFDFLVQRRAIPGKMPIEDPRIEWREAEAPFVAVARIEIPSQVIDTPERRRLAETLSFTPWHGLDAHRPLGGINRVRRTVYETVSRLRHEMNGDERLEPQAF